MKTNPSNIMNQKQLKKSSLDEITEYSRSRDEVEAKRREELELSKAEKRRLKALEEDVPDALGGCGSIKKWEEVHGRGFWGNSTTGYIYDKDNK